MKQISQWFKGEKKRADRLVTLHDMVFNEKNYAYVFFRLRYFLLLIAASFISHLVLFYLLYLNLAENELMNLMAYWLGTMFFHAAWWGGLEVYRTKIRQYNYCHKKEKIPGEIGLWLTFTGCVAAILFLIGLGHLIYGITQTSVPGMLLSQLYIFVLLLSLSIQIMTRSFHSSIFAIRRVWRTPISLIIGSIISLIVILVTWPVLKMYALPLGLLVNALISNYLTFSYTRRMFRLLEFSVTWPTKSTFLRFLKEFKKKDYFISAFSYAIINLDAILIFIVLILVKAQATSELTLITLFLIAPLIAAGHDWVQLFYFDWKRIRNLNFSSFMTYFHQKVNFASPIIGCIATVLAALIAYTLFSKQAAELCFILLPFFAMRSLIAYRQILAFTSFHYWDVVLSGVLLTGGVAGVIFIDANFFVKIIGMLLVSLIVWQLLRRPLFGKTYSFDRYKLPVNFYLWLDCLACQTEPTVVLKLELVEGLTTSKIMKLARTLIQNYLGKSGELCFQNNALILFISEKDAEEATNRSLLLNTAGLIFKIRRQAHPEINGQALEQVTKGLLRNFIHRTTQLETLETLNSNFLEKFPMCTYFSPSAFYGAQVTQKPFAHSQLLIQAANAWLRQDIDKLKRTPFFISVLFYDKSIQAIYVLPKRTPADVRKEFFKWSSYIKQQNILHACASASGENEKEHRKPGFKSFFSLSH